MTRLLLDTSACSALFRGDTEVRRRVQEADEVFLNPAVLAELKTGFRRGRRRRENERTLGDFLDSPSVRVAPIDERTSDRYVAIQDFLREAGMPIPTNDLWIAATAMQHGLLVVTADEHFARVPQILVALLQRPGQSPPKTGA